MQQDRLPRTRCGHRDHPAGQSSPILDPPEQALECVPLLIEGLVLAASCRSVLPRQDARCALPLVLQRGDEPVDIIDAVSGQLVRLGKAEQETSGSLAIGGE